MKSNFSLGVGLIVLSSVASLIGCNAPTSSGVEPGSGSDDITAGQCKDKITKKVLDRALEITDTAQIATDNSYGGVKTLYGSGQTGQVVLVRVTDEVERSDYIVVQDGVGAGSCSIKKVFVAAEGRVPDDTAGAGLTLGGLGAACKAKLEAAVLKKARQINEGASVSGIKVIYGGDTLFGGAAIVRVTDETEPSDYVAGFTLGGDADQRAGTCQVKFTRLVADGSLAPVPGL